MAYACWRKSMVSCAISSTLVWIEPSLWRILLPIIFSSLVGILYFVRSRRSPLRPRQTKNKQLNDPIKSVQNLMTELG